MAQRNQHKTPPKGPTLGVIFWIACILLILVVFLFNRENIRRVLQNTEIIEVISQDLPAEPLIRDQNDEQLDVVSPEPEAAREPETSTEIEQPTQPATIPKVEPEVVPEIEPAPSIGVEQSPPATRVRTYNLYFLRISDDDSVVLEPRPRGIRFVDSPLSATLQALLAGPVESETTVGYLSLVPEGSQLISASIRGETAFLNFNESFRFNPLGYEGQKAQLQQIVYTATEFPTVSQVQILIDGQIVNYLGGDSLYVGAPLQRGSF
ncbi:MAG: hypothetical protein GW949_09810 [Spirochaetales bacterium]|nr:hypothetical protein [Spirochaetales bacterium]